MKEGNKKIRIISGSLLLSGTDQRTELTYHIILYASCMDITVITDQSSDNQYDHCLSLFPSDLITVDFDKGFLHYFPPLLKFFLDQFCDLLVVMCQDIDLRKRARAVFAEVVCCNV